jgi:hypothetical protein
MQLDAHEKHALRALIDSAYAPDNCDHELCVLLTELKSAHTDGVPAHVHSRVPVLRRIYSMALDSGWNLPCVDKKRIGGTLLYLGNRSEATLADAEISVLQAAAVDLLLSDCAAELELYENFCELREETAESKKPVETRADWLAHKREQLQPEKRCLFGMRFSKPRRSAGTLQPAT